MDARLYRHARGNGTFIAPLNVKKKWGNDVVYGGIFLLRDFDYYIRTLDAYHICSLSTLLKNHSRDLHHRLLTSITPITFSTVNDFCSLQYEEHSPIKSHVYWGNPTHPKINQRLHSQARPNRITDGVEKEHFNALLKEVL